MNWQQIPLGECLQLAPAPITLLEHAVYQQGVLQAYPRGLVQKSTKRGFEFPKKRQKQVNAGQFVISRRRVQQRKWGIVPNTLAGAIVTQDYAIFDLYPSLNPEYLAAYLATALFRNATFAACNKRGWLVVREFVRTTIPLPSRQDQARIAELWKLANMALTHTQEMLASIEAVKTGIADQLFQNRNSSWEQQTLGACSTIGYDLTGSYALTVAPPDQVIWGSGLFSGGEIGIAPYPELDSLFLYYYLQSRKAKLQPILSSTQNKPEEALKAFPLPLPNLYEQRKLAMVIQQHDEVLSCLRTEQSALRKLIQGMMHHIFSGTLRIEEALPLLRAGSAQAEM